MEQFSDLFIKEHEGRIYHFLVESLEKPLLERILQYTGGNKLQAARLLGINRNTLHTKLKKLGIRK
jgi:DNA-binding protein Fis